MRSLRSFRPLHVAAALLTIAVVAVTVSCRASARAQKPVSVMTPDGVQLAVSVIGRGRDTVIVPLASHLIDDLQALAEDHVLIAYDPRSRGGSQSVRDAERLGLERDIADLETVRRRFGITRAQLLGWSYFAGVVANYAGTYPANVDRVVLLAPMAPRAEPYPADSAARPDVADTVPESMLQRARANGATTRDPVGYCRLAHHADAATIMGIPSAYRLRRADPCRFTNEWPDSLVLAIGPVLTKLGNYDWRPMWRAQRVPTLVIVGDRDMFPMSAARDWTRIGVTLSVLPGAGHYPHLEAPREMMSVIRSFLSSAH